MNVDANAGNEDPLDAMTLFDMFNSTTCARATHAGRIYPSYYPSRVTDSLTD